ncbi:Fc receptor-like protein 5 isoform 1-T1 [Menidia menidia]
MISECSLLQPRLTGPEKAFLNSRVAFRCVAPGAPPPVTYRLLRDGGAPVATHVDDEGGQTAVFPLKVTTAMGGAYRCRAAAGGITGVSAGVRLTVVTPASNTRVESDPSPPVAFEGSRVALSCEVDRGSHLSYTWFFNRTEVGGSWPGLRASGSRLVLERATPQQAGGYYCVAWATVQDTRRFSTSTEIQVVVKVFLSKPMISFSMVKVGDGYRGNVTCWCSRGSPPANFSLWVDGRPVGWFTATGALAVSFPVPAAPGLDMGEARCRVQSPRQQLHSEPLSLEVVPVGGGLRVELEYLYSVGSGRAAARLCCLLVRGTFPSFSWLLNGSQLPAAGRSLLLPVIGPKEAGQYACRARDSYEPHGPWAQSPAVMVQPTEPDTTPLDAIAILFCCFFLLTLVVGSICVYKMFDRKPAPTHVPAAHSLLVPPPPSSPAPSECESQSDSDPDQTMEITV